MTLLDIRPAPSPNFDSRGGAEIELVVLHYTGMRTGTAALRKLRDPSPLWSTYADDIPPAYAPADPSAPLPRASAHYLVEVDGSAFALVDEAERAWHAGVSSWRGSEGVNAASIGIEIVNGGHDYRDAQGRPPAYPEAQVQSVIALLADILDRRGLSPASVVGHSDIAPGRKLDPGEHFPWDRLAAAGVARARPVPPPGPVVFLSRRGEAGGVVRRAQEGLIDLGYGLAASSGFDDRTEAVIEAFQRRWRPERVDGLLDSETLALIEALTGRQRAGR